MIKKSIEIFQLHLKNYLKKDKFGDNMTNILNGNDNIIKLIEKKLNDDNFVLAETLLYLFEKNSLNYLKNVNIDEEPLNILKDCINPLYH